MYSSFSSIQSGKESLIDVLELLNQNLPKKNDDKPFKKISFKQNIRFNSLGFMYKSSKNMTLKNIDFEIKKGSIVGIIGKTGSGKSTLLDILMCLLKPTEGSLSIDGKLLSENYFEYWQSLISHVPQEIFIADTTIAENIALGQKITDIDFKKIEIVSKQAQIYDFIESLDDKYFTKVGELGSRLSGGEKQRLGIARALYRKSKLIIFDEATSALDQVTEKNIMDNIKKLYKQITFVIVAHRLITLKDCDILVKIEKGKIINIVSNKKLIKKMTLHNI